MRTKKESLKSFYVKCLIIFRMAVPAAFKEKKQDHSVKRGSPVKLTCMAEGDQPMSITWSKESNTLNKWGSNRYEIFENAVKDGLKSELIIRSAEKSDDGQYICRAENEFGKDERTNHVHVVEAPSAPSKIHSRELWSRQATIDWDEPSSHYRSPVLGYVVRYWKVGSSRRPNEINVTETNYLLDSLDPGSEYDITVSAFNEIGRGSPTETFRLRTREEPPSGVPTDIKAIPRGPTTIRVTWRAPLKETWNGQLTGYEVGYKDSSEYSSAFSFRSVYQSNHNDTMEYFLGSLLKETEYSIVVRARNQMGAGPLSQTINVKTLSGDLPVPPNIRVLSNTYDSVTLGYIVNRNRPIQISGLELHYRTKDEFEWRVLSFAIPDSVSEGEYSLFDLDENTYYQLYLTASSERGSSDPSKIVTIKTFKRGLSGTGPESQSTLDYLISDTITILSITTAIVIVIIVTIVAFVCVRIAKLKASKPNFDFCGATLGGYDKGPLHVGSNQRYNESSRKNLLQGNIGLSDDFTSTQYPIPYSTLPMNSDTKWNQTPVLKAGSVSKIKNDGRHVYDCPQ